MTTFDTNRSSFGSTGPFAALARAFGAVVAWNDARVTRQSLSKLTARELDDIGLCRGDIDAIANRATH